MKHASMPEGPSKGHTVQLEPMLTKYYKMRGLDADGRLTKERLDLWKYKKINRASEGIIGVGR